MSESRATLKFLKKQGWRQSRNGFLQADSARRLAAGESASSLEFPGEPNARPLFVVQAMKLHLVLLPGRAQSACVVPKSSRSLASMSDNGRLLAGPH